jgi:hypothetical protein
LNVLDHESRLADHFGGRMHLGMVQIREKYEEMKVCLQYFEYFHIKMTTCFRKQSMNVVQQNVNPTINQIVTGG